jgi:hypothetical protein
MKEENPDLQLALEEMRFNMQQSLSAGDALDGKVNLVLVAAGLVVAITATLEISLDPNRSDLYWFVLLLAVGFYFAAIASVLIGSRPTGYHLAISSEWDELDRHIFGRPEREALLSLLSGYVDQIQHNEAINKRKARMYTLSLLLLFLTVVLLIVSVAI